MRHALVLVLVLVLVVVLVGCGGGGGNAPDAELELADAPAHGDAMLDTLRIDAAPDASAPTGALSFTPPSLDVGQLQDGHAVTGTIQLHNTGPSDAPLDGFIVSGAGFSVSGTTCGVALDANATCDVEIEFEPVALGVNTGGISIASNGVQTAATLTDHGARRITVEFPGSGSGTVESTPLGLSCRTPCSALFETEVTLTATPDPGVVSTLLCGSDSLTCTVPATFSDVAITVDFSLTAAGSGSSGGSGSGSGSSSGPPGPDAVELQFVGGGLAVGAVNDTACYADCTVAVSAGQSVDITIGASYGFGGLSGECTTSTAGCHFTQPTGTAVVVARVDKSPNERWTLLPAVGAVVSAAYDTDGNLVLLGDHLSKLSPAGDVLWSIVNTEWQVVATAPGDAIYVGGQSTITKLDDNGNALWSQPGGGCAVNRCIAVGDDGAVATSSRGVVTWWDGDGMTTWSASLATQPSVGETAITIDHTGLVSAAVYDNSLATAAIEQLSATGSALSEGSLQNGLDVTIATDPANRRWATSYFGESVYLTGPTPLTSFAGQGTQSVAAASSGSTDIAWEYTDEAGNGEEHVVRRVGATALELDYEAIDIAAIAVDPSGNIAVVGTLDTFFTQPMTIVQTFAP